MEQLVRTFETSYIHVAGFLDHMLSKVDVLCNQAVDVLLQSGVNVKQLNADPRGRAAVRMAVEAYITHECYAKLFAAVTEDNAAHDITFDRIVLSGVHVASALVGVPPEYDCDLSKPVTMLSALNAARSPLEKLLCIKAFIEQVSHTVANHVKSRTGKAVQLATDDILPIVVLCILRAQLPQLTSHITYTSKFAFALNDEHDLCFNLVTIQAAMQYITDELPKLLTVPDTTSADVSPDIRRSNSTTAKPQSATDQLGQLRIDDGSGVARAASSGGDAASRQAQARVKEQKAAPAGGSLLLRLSRGY